MHKFILSLLVFIGSLQAVNAQETAKHLDIYQTYKEAELLIQQQKYSIAAPLIDDFLKKASKQTLDKSNTINANATFYKALCAKATVSPESEKLLIDFINNYAGNKFVNDANFHLGDIAYAKANYTDVLVYFDKVNEKALAELDNEDFQYKRAFSHFALKHFAEARNYFNKIANTKKSKNIEDAQYYSGLSSYYLKDYNTAQKTFIALQESKKYGKIVPYYIASVKFINKDYKGVVDFAEPKLTENVKYTNEISHLLGSSYFELKDYKKAEYYLQNYIINATKITPEDYYTLAYVQVQNNDCKKAIENLLQLSPLQNALAQNAMFLLGQCYEKTGDKTNAKNAFQNAARLNFDKNITEEATFQYAKLSYELENLNDALLTIKKFLTDYPNSTFNNEAKELLADIFLRTRNYEEAMDIIDKLPTKNDKLKEAYQKMAYYRGVEFYNDKNFKDAEIYFNKSLKYTNSKSIEALTYYWKADMNHQKNNFDESILLLNKFLPIATEIKAEHNNKIDLALGNYLQGYNYYKKKEYNTADDYFSNAAAKLKTNSDDNVKQYVYPDNIIRLADCYFIAKNYKNASSYYDEVIKANYQGADYALYQKSIIDGLGGKLENKIAGMKTLIARFPNSAFTDDAYMQTGKAYLALEKDNDAIESFNSLIQKNIKSELIPEAYLKLGLIYFNQDNYEQALNFYQKVVENYQKIPESKEAMLAIKDIYIAKGEPNAYFNYAKKYPNMNITLTEQDSIMYLAAETQFQKNNFEKAAEAYSNYLLQFPNGFFALQAHYYRAECLYLKQDFTKAELDYDYVANLPQNRFTERATARAANINYYDLKNYAKANTLYKKLETIATQDENKREFPIGLMRTNYQLKNYTECLNYIAKVNAITNLPDVYKPEIYFYKGMSLYNTNDYDNAIKELEKLIKLQTSEQAAAAKYTIAKINFNKKNYKQSEKVCNEYINDFPSYSYYLAKTYVLMSDIFVVNKNYFQAKAYLQSLLDNYEKEDEVKQEAQTKLAAIIAIETATGKLKLNDNGTQMQFEK